VLEAHEYPEEMHPWVNARRHSTPVLGTRWHQLKFLERQRYQPNFTLLRELLGRNEPKRVALADALGTPLPDATWSSLIESVGAVWERIGYRAGLPGPELRRRELAGLAGLKRVDYELGLLRTFRGELGDEPEVASAPRRARRRPSPPRRTRTVDDPEKMARLIEPCFQAPSGDRMRR
jgi:hypothetical protein